VSEEKRMCSKCGPVTEGRWHSCEDETCTTRGFPDWHELVRVSGCGGKSDPIASPPHYRSHPSGVEALTITEHHSFCLGNTIKYLWRAGQKDGEDLKKDLAKAWFYLTRECLRLEVDLPEIEAISAIDGLPAKS